MTIIKSNRVAGTVSQATAAKKATDHANHSVSRGANKYKEYARKLKIRLKRAVGLPTGNFEGVNTPSEVEKHIEFTAYKVLSQLAQGRNPFVTYNQIKKGAEIAAARSVGNDYHNYLPKEAELSSRLNRLASVILEKAMEDVAKQVGGVLSSDEVEFFLTKNVSIGRVMAVSAPALYKAYTKSMRVSFCSIPQITKALSIAEQEEMFETWDHIDRKLTDLHTIDNYACRDEGRSSIEDRGEFLELMHPSDVEDKAAW